MMRHINIPIFIPHEGCGNLCVFCNQRSITGKSLRADRDICAEIEEALFSINKIRQKQEIKVQIAFFGGSFTGIDRALMIRLLQDASKYIESGEVSSIRLSTRPDYIDEEILSILKKYGVENIELGIQSMDDEVLSASKRGHSAEQTKKACKMILEHGFSLTGQMMLGLPKSTLQKELECAREIVNMGAQSCRIYPAVVFCNTELCNMAKSGEYEPLTNMDAVERALQVAKVFVNAGVEILRIGLHSSEELASQEEVYAGANHPSLGEIVQSRLYLELILEKCQKLFESDIKDAYLKIFCANDAVSKVAGHKKINKEKIKEEFLKHKINLHEVKVCKNESFGKYEIETSLIRINKKEQL